MTRSQDPPQTVIGKSRIRYIRARRPSLRKGRYRIDVSQDFQETLNATARPGPQISNLTKTAIPDGSSIEAHHYFEVDGPRFLLDSEVAHAVYPPNGAHGQFDRVLPHVVLSRSMLPWERNGDAGGGDAPWLCLLTLCESDEPFLRKGATSTPSGTHVMPLDKLVETDGVHVIVRPSAGDLAPPPNAGENGTSMVQVLDIDIAHARELLPKTARDLSHLAFVRQSQVDGKYLPEMAIVLGHNPAKSGERCTVHLVSLEGAYKGDELLPDAPKSGVHLRLVSLHSWRFSCDKKVKHGFVTTAETVERNTRFLRLDLALQKDNPAIPAVEAGAVPLQYSLGVEETIVWYRGPLVPGVVTANAADGPGSVRRADDLVQVDTGLGILDYSYVVAWEFGRHLAMADTTFMQALHNWRAHQGHRSAEETCKRAGIETGHIPTILDEAEPAFPADWLLRIADLKSVPFRYLIADERLLPTESLRFFRVDAGWLRYAMLGATSVGSFDVEVGDCAENPVRQLLPPISDGRSGFILRSELLTNWPGLHMDGLSETGQKLEPVSRVEPVPGLSLILFDKPLSAVEFGLPPQILHFELSEEDYPDTMEPPQIRKAFADFLAGLNPKSPAPPVRHETAHRRRIGLPVGD